MSTRARKPGPRSLELLRWIERLEVVGLEPLALAHRLSQRTTYSHVERLAGAGLVDRIYDRKGTLVAITRAGRRVARPDAGTLEPLIEASPGVRSALTLGPVVGRRAGDASRIQLGERS